MIEKYIALLKSFGRGIYLSENVSTAMSEIIAAFTLLLVSLGVYFLVTFIVKKTVYRFIQHTTNKYDDLLIQNKVISRICLLIPAIILSVFLPRVLPSFTGSVHFLVKLMNIVEIFICTMIINSFITTAEDLYNTHEMSKIKPITGTIQVSRIALYIITGIVIIAFAMGTKISNILISLGTMSAVIILVFQDTIKGFVGSIQLSVNDMLRLGDWIVVGPADGIVQEINLTTVKVQNWDNTISTIPTYALVSSPFTNWRGMTESDGRRIMRSINIDVHTIRYCTPEMLEKYKHYDLVKDYIIEREKEILKFNTANQVDTSELINGRQQTNLGIYRAYIKAYIYHNPKLNNNITTMVRQMQPTEFGVPLQIYTFSKEKEWVKYEEVQSDLFDHIISAATMFDLKIYQKR